MRDMGHRKVVVALDERQNIVGAVMHVPTEPRREHRTGSFSWFFTSPRLPMERRLLVAKDLMDETHRQMREGGFETVMVTMGTHEGRRYLEKRHGYEQDPKDAEVWRKEL
jgi:hypothetical protein